MSRRHRDTTQPRAPRHQTRTPITASRLASAEHCRAQGWVSGTKIKSDKWKLIRTIVDVGPYDVTVTDGSNSNNVRTFPSDVTAQV